MYLDRITNRLSVSPTDLANFLACRHKTALDRLVAKGALRKPTWIEPLAAVLSDRGDAHEHSYVEQLRAQGRSILNLKDVATDDAERQAREAMRSGVDVIVQAPLRVDGWFGVADVLYRVAKPSSLGAWSYEAHDTKLSRETRGGTILQLCSYSELLKALQGTLPEHFQVVTPASSERFRVDDFAAFYRNVKERFLRLAGGTVVAEPAEVPDAVEHCGVCRWFVHCDKSRRRADHLSYVAGLGRTHQQEFESQGIRTLAALGAMPLPLPFTPRRGAPETYERLREQARLQRASRDSGQLQHELLPIEAGFGLTRLPDPTPGDLFLDLEGDPFVESLVSQSGASQQPVAGGREYLFGLGRVGADDAFVYDAYWGTTPGDERRAFEAVMDRIMAALDADPAVHVYHYAAYEPSAFKRLMGRYATREADVDRLLRGRRFVDLYAIVRHALRAGVEHYSIKDLEPLYAFQRSIDLRHAGDQRRVVELALETNDLSAITADVRAGVERYNADDCRSALALRDWLERVRRERIDRGLAIPRPELDPVEAAEEISERQQRIEALRKRLLARDEDSASGPHHVLAYLLDWHYREDKVAWWEYYRLLELDDEDLLDERMAVSGLERLDRLGEVRNKATGRPTGSVIDRYRYPAQEMDIRAGAKLFQRDESSFGEVLAVDRVARTLDVKKGRAASDIHPSSAFTHERVSPDVPAAALFRLGEEVVDRGFDGARNQAAVDLLLRRPPRFATTTLVDIGNELLPAAGESATQLAVRVIGNLSQSALPIQGPPGSGKTFTGARMICELVRQGKRVGVTGPSHKVIRNLLEAVDDAAAEMGVRVRLGQKTKDDAEPEAASSIFQFSKNEDAEQAISRNLIDVLGGTAWLWAREESERSVDVLFVDEAGQMSLANTIAASHGAASLVLLGDPQQLEQPQKGSHPPGVDVSALDHILQGEQTMPAERGLFLPVTWRLCPEICRFTSELFYEGKLKSKPGLERQLLRGVPRFGGAGLFMIDVAHHGCVNASDAEVDVVAGIVAELTSGDARWIDERGDARPITTNDVLIVAPYNAHVSRLQERLKDCRVGTVDKFQGQEAPVVIYAMATSRPEDAPRGMEFLYSLNRLNVATSRAKCACILVASPYLFEPDCATPRQMRLANALARYRELARRVS